MNDIKDLEIPTGLSQKGRQAARVIVAFLKEKELTETGGCRVFYTPREWKARGEKYGTTSELVVVYDGAEAAYALAMDYEMYKAIDELQARLDAIGVFFEEATCWYGSIHIA